VSFTSIYKGYAIYSISVGPGWAARRASEEGKEGVPFDLAATSFNEIQAEIDAAVKVEEALEEYLDPDSKQ
jgi:hypothetical protein